jgi:hypothetical protein
MGQITREFDEPFSNSTASLSSSFGASVVGLNGVPYLLDTVGGNYRRQAVDVVQQRNTSDNRDLLLLPQDVWRQMQQSWNMGTGQSNQDRDTSLPYRYEDSFGVDPWDQWSIKLLPTTEQLSSEGEGALTFSGNVWLSVSQGYLCVYNAETLYWFDELSTTATPYDSTVISAGHDIVDIASQGPFPIVLTDDDHVWYATDPAATPVKWTTHHFTGATFIAWEKDRLIVGDENVLYDSEKNDASPTIIYTHPDTNFRWYSAASGSQFIYVLGRSNNKTTIHKVGITASSAATITLSTAIVAASLPDGEIGYTIDSYLGFIFIGTDKGIRMAVADSNGDLTLGPILPTTKPVLCFEGEDRFVWFGNSGATANYTPFPLNDPANFPANPVAGLGRMDLSTFTTSQLTPAYANDITTVLENEEVQSVVTFKDKRVFSVSNSGIFFESDDLVENGYLSQGIMSFSVEDLKTGLYVQAKWKPLEGAVALDVAYDSGEWRRIARVSTPDSIRSSNISMNGVQFSRFNSRYVLYRDVNPLEPIDTTSGPIFTRFEMRAIPVKGQASRWTLPIQNFETLEIDGVIYNRDVLVQFNNLVSLAQSGQIFTLQEAGNAYQVHAKDFLWQPEKLSSNKQGWQGLFTMIVEEVQ